jgi:DNA-binding MarR family transcriptional regulator
MMDEPAFLRLPDLDRIVHEPARLAIMAVLYTVESADFRYLLHATELTKGNLSSHLMRLEEAGYVQINKGFRGKIPQTICVLTPSGRQAFRTYRQRLRQAVDALPTAD